MPDIELSIAKRLANLEAQLKNEVEEMNKEYKKYNLNVSNVYAELNCDTLDLNEKSDDELYVIYRKVFNRQSVLKEIYINELKKPVTKKYDDLNEFMDFIRQTIEMIQQYVFSSVFEDNEWYINLDKYFSTDGKTRNILVNTVKNIPIDFYNNLELFINYCNNSTSSFDVKYKVMKDSKNQMRWCIIKIKNKEIS
uniref:Uncharacterized protein n=1 Tax=viral metagenome TaxID=1070528 RepID=A0A6C0EBC2_9ZZZZ